MTDERLVRLALEEDIGNGDITTEACVDPKITGTGTILAKQELVLSGTRLAALTFAQLGVTATLTRQDGERLSRGEVVMTLAGPFAGILSAERVALNFLMRLSGIATHTADVVAAARGQVKVVCTRKTTPLHRGPEKAAVRHGGGVNHRHGLYDGVLIKDNHIIAAGGIAEAVRRARQSAHHLLRVEVEVESLQELRQALDARADVILLDNMDDATLAEAVRINAGRAVLEASGNMDAERIAKIRDLGLDLVSVGGLVHQSRWVDLSLRLDPPA